MSAAAGAGTSHVHVAVIGAGFGGLGAAVRLRQRGFTDFLVFEKADDVGGTWRDNSYPGCACDVPSHLYCFSFAPNPQWRDTFSGQAEIWDYLRAVATRHGVDPHLRLGHEVRDLAWDDAAGHWRLATSRGEFTADVVVAAGGPLSDPAIPELAGLFTFGGTVFHSANWRHDHDLTGRRVAVVGTGASAIQFVPEIQPKVGALLLFQRTPAWVMPRRSRRLTALEHAIYRRLPLAQRLARAGIYWGREVLALAFQHPPLMGVVRRLGLRQLRRQVPDVDLRARLTPRYTPGCKRMLLSNDYLPSLTRPNVEVVTAGIREVRPQGIVTEDGALHEVDTIIFGTGFHVTDPPLTRMVRGRGGTRLADAWRETMTAYLGTTVAGFPNLFLLLGPNTGLGHNSVVFMIESQLRHVLGALEHMRRTGVRVLEPTPAAQRDFVARVDARMRGTVWLRGGCQSWYLDSGGRNSTLWPGFSFSYRLRARRFRASAYGA